MRNLLLLIVIVYVVWRLAQALRRKGEAARRDQVAAGQMVACGHCGLYVPRAEALAEGERYFCSEEHRRAYTDRP